MGGHPGLGGSSRTWGVIQDLGGHPGLGGSSRTWGVIQDLGGHPGLGGSSRTWAESGRILVGHCAVFDEGV